MFWSDVTITSKPDASAALSSSPFSSCGCHRISTKVRTSCMDRNRRTPTGTFLSNTMRNAVTLGVSQNRLDPVRRNLKLFHDFGDAHAIVEVIDNRVHRHPRSEQNGSAALHSGPDLDERAFRPVDFFFRSHWRTSRHYDSTFLPRRPTPSLLPTPSSAQIGRASCRERVLIS